MASGEIPNMKDRQGSSDPNPCIYDMNSYSSVKVAAIPQPVSPTDQKADGEDMEDDASDGSDDFELEVFQYKKKKQRRPGQWILENFKKKGCIKFVQDPNRANRICHCGRNRRGHTSLPRRSSEERLVSLRRPSEPGQSVSRSMSAQVLAPKEKANDKGDGEATWKTDENLVEFPTDAFGEIQFKESVERLSTAKFVRLSDNTEMKLILHLLTKYWKLSKPRLVISLTGGGRNFSINHKDKETFSRGIFKAACTTDAWIITTGFNAGVPPLVGSIVQLSQTQHWIMNTRNMKKGQERSRLNCIGLTPWGYVDGSHQLLTRHGQGSYPAHYKVNPVVSKGRPIPLNADHTHFILIDNGLKGEESYGSEIKMRSMIEKAISAPQEEDGLGLPVVLVVLEGGIDTIFNVKNAVERSIPAVVCDGSGRAADLIAFAYNRAEGENDSRTLNDANRDVLRVKVQHAFNMDPDDLTELDNLVEDVILCIKYKKMMTVFQMVDTVENAGLDHAILTGLLKAQASTPTYKLALALSWNRVDVAEKKIFVDDQDWPPGSLDPYIMQSLMHNQVDFLRLFLQQGAIMKDFLTVARLRRLYNSVSQQHALRFYVASVNNTKPHRHIYLQHIGKLIKALMGIHRNKLYVNDKPFTCARKESVGLMALTSALAGSLLTHQAQEEYLKSDTYWNGTTDSPLKLSMIELANPGLHFKYPFQELFLCAVLMCRMEMAVFFWERIENTICSGIVASTILKGMAAMAKDPDDSLEAEKNARTFELLAVDVMDECYKTDEILTERLIRSPNKNWGGKSILKMAAEADNKTFIAHSCPQSVVKKIWLGGMRSNTWIVYLAILFPFLIYKIKFEKQFAPKKGLPKMWRFYSSPITKFGTFAMSYIAFLVLYSYIMLAKFNNKPGCAEIVLFTWIGTMAIDEIRQACIPNDWETVKQRFMDWVRSEWNMFDAITTVVACLAFLLHYYAGENVTTLDWSKGFYAINCFLYYSRLLRLFSVNGKLGPKMVMIRKMMGEMAVFLCIFLVFLLGYGIASSILLYPHKEFGIYVIGYAIYRPYFQIYGELFLEDIYFQDGMDKDSDKPETHILILFMLGIFLLLGNVLLLNLLIAIFSSIFDEVETNSLEVWKTELYFLMVEFEDRPTLPPPFIILEHAFQVLYWLWRKIFMKCCRKIDDEMVYLTKKMKRALRAFEKDCVANYRQQKIEKKSTETPERLGLIEKKLRELDRQAEKTKRDIQRRLQHIQQLLGNVSPALDRQKQLTNVKDSFSTLPYAPDEEEEETMKEPATKMFDNTLPRSFTRQKNSKQRRGSSLPGTDVKSTESSRPTLFSEQVKQRQKELLHKLNEEMVLARPSSRLPALGGSHRSLKHSRWGRPSKIGIDDSGHQPGLPSYMYDSDIPSDSPAMSRHQLDESDAIPSKFTQLSWRY